MKDKRTCGSCYTGVPMTALPVTRGERYICEKCGSEEHDVEYAKYRAAEKRKLHELLEKLPKAIERAPAVNVPLRRSKVAH